MDKLTPDEQAYLDKMKASLRELGVSLASGEDIQEQARVINNRTVSAQAYIERLEQALLVFGLNPQNETIDLRDCARAYARGRADEQAMLDTAQARVKELEKTLEASRSATQTYASAEIRANEHAAKAKARAKELEAACTQATAQISAQAGELGKVYAERDAMKERAAKAEDALLKLRAAKCLYAMDASAERAALEESIRAGLANLSSAGIVVERADPAREELAQIWELWGAGRPMTPGCVYDAAQAEESRGTKLHIKLGQIAELLNGANIPQRYGRDQQGGEIPLPERVGLLIDLHDSTRMLAESWEERANREIGERMDADALLDDLGAPSHAGAVHLTTAARIRALPGLLRPE